MKYTPILGEAVAEEILGEKSVSKKFDYNKFNIKRFGDDYMKKFWNLVNGEKIPCIGKVKTHYNVTSPQLKKS